MAYGNGYSRSTYAPQAYAPQAYPPRAYPQSAYNPQFPIQETAQQRVKAAPQAIFAGVGLAFVILASAWTLYSRVSVGSGEAKAAVTPLETAAIALAVEEATFAERIEAFANSQTVPLAVQQGYMTLLDPTRFLGSSPNTFVASAPAQPDPRSAASVTIASAKPQDELPAQRAPAPIQLAERIPLPAPRPSVVRSTGSGIVDRAISQLSKQVALAPSDPEEPSLFQKLFGRTPSSPGTQLAYAAPDGGVLSNGQEATAGSVDKQTAVYDISARVVYMPDGSKLEAHSGLGNKLDDPRYVNVKMHGATPPHVYDLSLRESLFHGVQALRLKPLGGEGAIYGRTGLLAHTYMLGPNGDSNGCVSFRNYEAFLRAYKNGEVKRLVVVAKL